MINSVSAYDEAVMRSDIKVLSLAVLAVLLSLFDVYDMIKALNIIKQRNHYIPLLYNDGNKFLISIYV